MANQAIIIQTSSTDKKQLQLLASELVKQSLAACVTLIPSVRSVYRWESKVVSETEHLLEIKTVEHKKPAIKSLIDSYIKYDCPQFIVIKIDSFSKDYESWFMEMIND